MNFSGLANEAFLGDDLPATPDAMDAEMAEVGLNAYDTEDTEQDLLDAETVSQGKKLITSRFLCANNYLIASDSTNQSSHIEAGDLDTTPTFFIKEFPFGRPRAPIDSAPHHCATASGVTSPGDSIWAPFRSQLDWNIAQWVKTQRLTASAFSELLAFPKVW